MKTWSTDPVAWLMGFSMLFLLIVDGVWINKTYLEEKRGLQRELGMLYYSTIRELEDSLVQQAMFVQADSQFVVVRLNRGNRIAQDALDHPGHRIEVISSGKKHFEDGDSILKIRESFHGRPGRERAIHGGLLVHFKGAIRDSVLAEDFSDSLKLAVSGRVSEKFGEAFTERGYPFDFGVGPDSSSVQGATMFTRPYKELFHPFTLIAGFSGYQWYLLRRSIPTIAFLAVLTALIGLAFFLAYQGLRKQRKLTALGNELVNNISHELKTPITTVNVALEALQDFDTRDDKAKRTEYIAIARRELNRLTLLVENVMQTARFRDKTQEPITQPFDLGNLAHEVMDAMQIQFDQKDIRLVRQVEEKGLELDADRMQISGVLFNLLDNALKYSEGGTTVTVSLASTETHCEIVVADEGIGIPKAYREKVFQKFVRIPDERGHVVKGHGLGLYFVKQVVDEHRGNLKLNTNPEGGTTITIHLPKRHA